MMKLCGALMEISFTLAGGAAQLDPQSQHSHRRAWQATECKTGGCQVTYPPSPLCDCPRNKPRQKGQREEIQYFCKKEMIIIKTKETKL